MSKAYVPPHKRKDAPVSLKPEDFPSLTGNVPVRAGAGGPSYVSKATPSSAAVETVKEEKYVPTFVGKAFRKAPKEEYVAKEVFENPTSSSDDGWQTIESRNPTKKSTRSEWDDFDNY